MTDTIKILLVDDHSLLLETLSDRLEKEGDIEVVGTATDADSGLKLARQHEPDIIMFDVDMPGLLCFDAAKQASTLIDNIKCMFLSAYANDHYINQALKAKGYAYLVKEEQPGRIIEAIREVHKGNCFFSDQILNRIVFDNNRPKLANEPNALISKLTQRELEVMNYLARGLTKQEIGKIIKVSPKTVDKHAENLMRKLKIHNRVELTRFAIREGITQA